MKAPNIEQLTALLAWIDSRPKMQWKRDLLRAWENAGQGVDGYSPALQQVRNSHGPEWLARQSRQSIERMLDGATIRAAAKGVLK